MTGHQVVSNDFLTLNALDVHHGLDVCYFRRSLGSLSSSGSFCLNLKLPISFLLLFDLKLLEKVSFLFLFELSFGLLPNFFLALFLDPLASHSFVALFLALDLAINRILML